MLKKTIIIINKINNNNTTRGRSSCTARPCVGPAILPCRSSSSTASRSSAWARRSTACYRYSRWRQTAAGCTAWCCWSARTLRYSWSSCWNAWRSRMTPGTSPRSGYHSYRCMIRWMCCVDRPVYIPVVGVRRLTAPWRRDYVRLTRLSLTVRT